MSRPGTLLPALAVALLLGAAGALPAAAEDKPLDAALEAYGAGEYRRTVEAAEKVGKDDPGHARALYVAGEARLALREWEDAEKAFRGVLAVKPKAVPGLVGLGRALAGAGKAQEAEAPLREAVKLDPKDVPAKRALGEFLLGSGDVKGARKLLRAAYKLDTKNALTARALVEALLRDDAAKDAEKVAKRLVKSRPDHPMGHFLHGLVLDRRGKDDDAIAAYEKAISKDDHFLDAHKNLAILCTTDNPLYSNEERTEKAFAHYQRYFELGGDDPELKRLYETIKGFLDSLER